MSNFSIPYRTSLLACSAVLALCGSAAQADEADAKLILKAMSDYMTATQAFTFNYDSTLDIITNDNQKLGIAASGSVSLARPDKIHATREGGFVDIEMTFDGQTFSLLGKNAALYTQLPIEGSIEHMIDELRNRYGSPLPAADLLIPNAYDVLMSEVTDIKDLGVGVIQGQVCDHLAFRTPEIDWQIWIAQGDQPYPCRYIITTHAVSQAPQYRIDIRDWQTSEAPTGNAFTFTPPDGATEINLEAYLKQVKDLPDNYVTGDTQ